MPSLGNQLRQIEADAAARKAAEEEAAAKYAESEEGKRQAAVQTFFEDAKRLIRESISVGKQPPMFTTPHQVKCSGSNNILKAAHLDHRFFADFKTWADGEGLQVQGHDGDTAARFEVSARKP